MDIPWAGIVGVAILVLAMVFAGAVVKATRARQRLRATQLNPGQSPRRVARAVYGRLYVESSIVGGPRAGGFVRAQTDLVLTDRGLLAATHHGRVLEIDAEHPGRASCTGPGRLVLEGAHPSGSTRVRLEVMVEDADGWAAAISALSRA